MNTPLPPVPPSRDLAVELRHLSLSLMDAADLYDEDRRAEGQRAALEVVERVRVLVGGAAPA